jgi:peptidyl-prolyl cis-trans isomerase C
LAHDFSECPSGKEGGSLGEFGKGMMVPTFEKAVFQLMPGEVSGIVRTQFGFHIIKRVK